MIIKAIIPSAIKRFVRSYRLPLSATIIFAGLVIFLLLGRLHDRSVLGRILAVGNTSGGDYATLISKDKSDAFNKHEVSADDSRSPAVAPPTKVGSVPVATSPSYVVTPTAPNPPSTTTPSSITPSTTSPPSHTPPPPALPFTSTITDFRHLQTSPFTCPAGVTSFNYQTECYKTYTFSATIQTQNGPGTVDYDWDYNVPGSNSGAISVLAGTQSTNIKDTIKITCDNAGKFTAQFLINAPNADQSQLIEIRHQCF